MGGGFAAEPSGARRAGRPRAAGAGAGAVGDAVEGWGWGCGVCAAAAGPLTARQREVAGLVAEGLTNAQIAARLHLSERTVENHVFNAISALGLNNRVQLATWVAGEDRRRDGSGPHRRPSQPE